MGECVVIVCLAAVSALAIRSLWRKHRAGGCCGGCAGCGKCHERRQ